MSLHQPTPLQLHSPSTLVPTAQSAVNLDPRSDHTETDQDCIIVDTEPLSITEDGVKRKLSMPNISRRQSTGKATLRRRPSMSPSFSSFLTPTKLRISRRLSAQSPLATVSPTSPTALALSDPASPTMAKSKLPAIEAITNWLAVKPNLGQIDRPSSEPVAPPETIPAMLRYPPKDPNEIPHSPDCIDCAHKVAMKEGYTRPIGEEGEWSEERLDVEIGNTGESFREDKVDTTFGLYQSLSNVMDVGESPIRPDLRISTSTSGRRAFVSREGSCLDLVALPEHDEQVVFSSPEMSPIDDMADVSASTFNRSMTEEPEALPAVHRIWLCSPPPRSPVSPLALNSSSTLNVAAPVAMTRSKSEATVTTLTVAPRSTFSGRPKTTRRRPFVTRSISTGRLATEFDDQGRVVCMSDHSQRVLANKITAESCWRRPIASVPPTPTSPSQTSSPFGSMAKGRGSARGLPSPRRANSVQQDLPNEFGAPGRRSSLEGYDDQRGSVPVNGFSSFRAKGWLGTGSSVKV